MLIAIAAAAPGCASEEDPLPFDPTTQNLFLRGRFNGLDLDVAEAAVLEGEREYGSGLCEVSTEFDASIEGADWGIDIELSNFVAESFGVGRYEIIGEEDEQADGKIALEMRLDGEDAHYERSAIGGFIDIKIYDSDAGEGGEPLEGGSLGAVFEVEFGAGETVEGSFHVDFSATTVLDEEC
jgi:hypothetical protein